MTTPAERPKRVQLHLVLPYNIEIGAAPEVRRYLRRGYNIVQLQRLSDREVVVTLEDVLDLV